MCLKREEKQSCSVSLRNCYSLQQPQSLSFLYSPTAHGGDVFDPATANYHHHSHHQQRRQHYHRFIASQFLLSQTHLAAANWGTSTSCSGFTLKPLLLYATVFKHLFYHLRAFWFAVANWTEKWQEEIEELKTDGRFASVFCKVSGELFPSQLKEIHL